VRTVKNEREEGTCCNAKVFTAKRQKRGGKGKCRKDRRGTIRKKKNRPTTSGKEKSHKLRKGGVIIQKQREHNLTSV